MTKAVAFFSELAETECISNWNVMCVHTSRFRRYPIVCISLAWVDIIRIAHIQSKYASGCLFLLQEIQICLYTP